MTENIKISVNDVWIRFNLASECVDNIKDGCQCRSASSVVSSLLIASKRDLFPVILAIMK